MVYEEHFSKFHVVPSVENVRDGEKLYVSFC